MMLRLFLLFTVVPMVDLFLLLQLGAWLGPTAAIVLVLLTGVVGAWLAKREGFGVLATLAQELGQGIPPGERLMEGALVIVGGLLLVTPGVITDLTGFLLIVPFTRRRIAPIALAAFTRRIGVPGGIRVGWFSSGPAPGGPDRPAAPQRPTPFSNPYDD